MSTTEPPRPPRPLKKPRVRESCKPCRTRKTRCNAQVSCILRGTETDCALSQPLSSGPTKEQNSGNPDNGSLASITRDRFPGSHQHGPVPSPPSSDTTPIQPSLYPDRDRAADAEVARLQETIARLQADVDRLSRRGEDEVERANWARLVAILAAKATCETLLEYVVQEWFCGDIIGAWTRAIARSAAPRGVISTLCISLALPTFILRKHSTPLYPIPAAPDGTATLTLELERSLYELARAMVPDQLENIGDISALCDICSYLIYTQEIHHLAVIVARCEALAKREGYLDENHPSWAGLSEEDRRERRMVMLKLISQVRWKSIYTLRDDLADTRVNICRPALRDYSLRSPLDLDVAPDGGASWRSSSISSSSAAAAPPQSPSPPGLPPLARRSGGVVSVTDASELRLLRIKSAAEIARTKQIRMSMWNLSDHAPRLVRAVLRLPLPISSSSSKTPPTPSEDALSRAEVVYRDLLRFREAEMTTLGFTDDMIALSQLDPSSHTQRRLAFQILVLRSAVGHYLSNLLRPWLLCADARALAPHDPLPTRHAILARGALENAEWCMQCIPAIKALLPYPQAHLIGAFVSANLFNAATAFAVPVLRAVHAWSASECDGEEDVRALPAWPDNFYPFPVGVGVGAGASVEGKRARGVDVGGSASASASASRDEVDGGGGNDNGPGRGPGREHGQLSPRSPSPPPDPTLSRTHTEAHGRAHTHGAACDKGSATATPTTSASASDIPTSLQPQSIPTPMGTPPPHRSSNPVPSAPASAARPTRVRARCPGSPSPCNIKVPPSVYIDDSIKFYASSILVILDTLSLLRSNYLGNEAETRLRQLVRAHGIRESHEYVKRHPPSFGFTGTGARAGIFGGGPGGASGAGGGIGTGAGVGMDELRARAGRDTAGLGGVGSGSGGVGMGVGVDAPWTDVPSGASSGATLGGMGDTIEMPDYAGDVGYAGGTNTTTQHAYPLPAQSYSTTTTAATAAATRADYAPAPAERERKRPFGAPPPFMDREVPYGLGQALRPEEIAAQGGAGVGADSGFVLGPVLGGYARMGTGEGYGAFGEAGVGAGVDGAGAGVGAGPGPGPGPGKAYTGGMGGYGEFGAGVGTGGGGWVGTRGGVGMDMSMSADMGMGMGMGVGTGVVNEMGNFEYAADPRAGVGAGDGAGAGEYGAFTGEPGGFGMGFGTGDGSGFNGGDPGAGSGAGPGAGPPAGPPAAFMDLAWLDQLLGMDPSVWDGLLNE